MQPLRHEPRAAPGWHVRAGSPAGLAHSQCPPWGLLVRSDTPDPPHLLALGLRAPALGHVRALTPHKGKQTSPVGASGSLLHAGVFQELSQKRGVCTPWELPHSLF